MIKVIAGAQFGSEGKGHICAQLHEPGQISVRVGGSNAGHSVVDPNGRKWAFRHLPVATVLDAHSPLVIAAGSEIDLEVLCQEIDETQAAGWRTENRLLIDQSATIIDQHHKDAETELIQAIGSTGKGNGAARAARAMRTARRYCDVANDGVDTAGYLNYHHQHDRGQILIEGTQGYGLGVHGQFYPKCTSGDCRPIDFIAQAGIAPWAGTVSAWLVARTYPIRVAGDSGAMPGGETTWDEIGVEPERTTVTQKIRRVGNWDSPSVRTAITHSGPVNLALTFFDYWYPELHGVTDPAALTREHHESLNQLNIGSINMLGTSDRTVIDLR